MTLHFAYGSNMSRALMGARCRDAEAIGIATLSGWRFVINPEGFGSIAPRPGGCVHGVLWRLSARDLAAINAYESVDSGLYVRRRLPVRCGGVQAMALVYIARRQGEGTPRPGYISLVVEAARVPRTPGKWDERSRHPPRRHPRARAGRGLPRLRGIYRARSWASGLGAQPTGGRRRGGAGGAGGGGGAGGRGLSPRSAGRPRRRPRRA